ncbi:hypothetical protein F4810DRAFT_590273 [Camillea tinctor]|nr:hypothetical protein F4810DRAFT_590273 [Camillea tinctor]
MCVCVCMWVFLFFVSRDSTRQVEPAAQIGIATRKKEDIFFFFSYDRITKTPKYGTTRYSVFHGHTTYNTYLNPFGWPYL